MALEPGSASFSSKCHNVHSLKRLSCSFQSSYRRCFVLAKYRATDLLVAFDPLHLWSDGGGGPHPHALFVQHLHSNKKHPKKSERRNHHIPHKAKYLSPVDSIICSLVLQAALKAWIIGSDGKRVHAFILQVQQTQSRSCHRNTEQMHLHGGGEVLDSLQSLLESSWFHNKSTTVGKQLQKTIPQEHNTHKYILKGSWNREQNG